MATSWVDVDKLVHELGSLRAVVQEIEAQPGMSEDAVAIELRSMLDRAADIVHHLVVGGDDSVVSRAWQCIAEAREVGARARRALERVQATHDSTRSIRGETQAVKEATRAALAQAQRQIEQAEQRIDDLRRIRLGARPGAPEKRPKT